MRNFIQPITLLGRVVEIDDVKGSFGLRTRSGDVFYCFVQSPEVRYVSLRNVDESDISESNQQNETLKERCDRLRRLLAVDYLVSVEGTLLLNASKRRVDVRTVYLVYVDQLRGGSDLIKEERPVMVFETDDWWVNQIRVFADRWLYAQFGQSGEQFDFSNYRTYLDMFFKPTGTLQETATLSRLIYGLATSYMVTGTERYLKAAEAGIKYQQEHFRYYKDECCFWCHGKYADTYARLFESINGDDAGTIPLYEQIYAIAGLTQYYRITQDEAVFEDIRRTVLAFFKYFKDETQYGGYFSHLSPVDYTFTNARLGINREKKNWNSVGDHIPAYLINLLIVLEPLVQVRPDQILKDFLLRCRGLLDETTRLIVEKFPDPSDKVRFVNERFTRDWTPDHEYSWQQNRGIVGHNLKIAWNLSRVANYYESRGTQVISGTVKPIETERIMRLATRLGQSMVDANAVDLYRGGCYDALEREPSNEFDIEFAWASTKDFWQQEQAILAYLILYGRTKDRLYLELAQEMSAFWNIKFLDRKNGFVFFRTDANGVPVIEGSYGDKGGHAISGYHAFELCYLAHIYTQAYVTGSKLNLYLKPQIRQGKPQAISVLPDFLPLKQVRLEAVRVNGIERVLSAEERNGFYVLLRPEDNLAQINVQLGFTTQSYVLEKPSVPLVVPAPASVQLEKPGLVPSLPVPSTIQKRGRVGVIVEEHFDEKEIIEFRQKFPLAGYEVVYITNLWGQKSAEYYGNDFRDPLRVYVDFKDVDISKYAGFLLIGGYAMDRLRYEVNPLKGVQNQSPSVDFLRRILQAPNVKVGIICHSSWLFTVDKELLRGRTLTCAHNVVYDVLNAGGQVVYAPNGGTVDLHVDGNLISGKHPEVVGQFTQKFIEELNKVNVSCGY